MVQIGIYQNKLLYLILEIRAKEFKIIMRPTIKENKVKSWESNANGKNDIYILPSSFKMNEF